jgi:hypothetical protein
LIIETPLPEEVGFFVPHERRFQGIADVENDSGGSTY